MRLLSRRRLICGSGAALVGHTLLLKATQAEPEGTLLSGGARSVSYISPSDQQFKTSVDALYPGLADDPGFQTIAPLALLITHRKGRAIRAFSVSWKLTLPGGSSDIAMYYYASLGSPATGHISSSLGSARRNMLYPGQSRLVTPLFSWLPDDFQSDPKPEWSKLSFTEPAAFLISQMPFATELVTSVDAIVFSDWKLLGPDTHNLAGKLRTRRNAEHDEGLVVHKLLRDGASDDVISETLRSDGSALIKNNGTQNSRWYRAARRYHAQFLLNAFESADREKFVQAVARLKERRKTIITRLAS